MPNSVKHFYRSTPSFRLITSKRERMKHATTFPGTSLIIPRTYVVLLAGLFAHGIDRGSPRLSPQIAYSTVIYLLGSPHLINFARLITYRR